MSLYNAINPLDTFLRSFPVYREVANFCPPNLLRTCYGEIQTDVCNGFWPLLLNQDK